MNDTKFERLSLLVGGIGFAVLVLLSALIPGSPPGVDDSASDIVDYFQDHDTAIQWAAFLTGVGVILALWWLSGLWRAMRKAEAGDPRLTIMAATGFVLAGAAALVSAAVNSSVALRIDDVAAGSKYFYTLSFVIGGMTNFGIAAMVLAVSALAIRTKFLPSWLAWSGAVLGVLFVAAGCAVADDSDAALGLGFVVFLLWLVWFVILSVLLARKVDAA